MSINVSEIIRQAIVNENHDFSKVISDVADGCKLCGFFDEPNWKDMLEKCFERKRMGLTNEEIQIYTSVLSNSSYEAAFVNGMMSAVEESTPFASQTTVSRTKRSSTLNDEEPLRDMRKRFRPARASLDDDRLTSMLDDLKDTDWTEVLPPVNAKQNTTKYVNVFEKSKEIKQAVQRAVDNVAPNEPSSSNVTSSKITKRRVAVLRPTVKRPSSKPPAVSIPKGMLPKGSLRKDSVLKESVAKASVAKASVANVPKASETAASGNTKGSAVVDNAIVPGNASVPGDPIVLTNITNRRTTRRQTKLLAAFAGEATRSERRSSTFIQRSSVLFTMIDVQPYKDVLSKFNIFVADNNEKYDYVIAEKICRSPKFLSAIVSGKPIVSLDWIRALTTSSHWLNPLDYLLKDEDGEIQHSFNLTNTLTTANASNHKLFEKYSILVTPKAEIGPGGLKGVIFSGGGKYLKTSLVPRKGDAVFCVSSTADQKIWPKLEQKYPTLQKIISVDGFASMIFRYTHDVSEEHVLHERL